MRARPEVMSHIMRQTANHRKQVYKCKMLQKFAEHVCKRDGELVIDVLFYLAGT